jgi:hypothetical protein
MAWRIAHDLAREGASARLSAWRRTGSRRAWLPLALAATVVLAAGLGVVWINLLPGPSQELRTQEGGWLRSTLDEAAPLPADRLVLRWTAGPEGAVYDIRVTTEDLEIVAYAENLETPEYLVPAESLESVERGSVVYWQVTARLPDRRRVESDTFITQIE